MKNPGPGRPVIYLPHHSGFYMLLAALAVVAVLALIINLFTAAFIKVGFSWPVATLILFASLAGSGVNIPVFRLRTHQPVKRLQMVRYGGVIFRIPVDVIEERATIVAVNAGGALVPLAVSIYLLARFPEALALTAAATAVVSLVVNRLAQGVEGVGIVIRGFWPPVITAVTVLVLAAVFAASAESRFVAAYAGGSAGTLVGADLLNLRLLPRLGAGIGSIGGAGTFDGIFLAGIVAVLLV